MGSWSFNEIRKSYGGLIEESLIEFSQFMASDLAARSSNGVMEFEKVQATFNRYKENPIRASIGGIPKYSSSLNMYVTDAKGVVIYHSEKPNEVGRDYSQWNDVYLTLKGKYGARSTRIDPKNALTSVFYIAAPIRVNNRIIGVVSVYKPEQNIQSFFEKFRLKLIIGIMIVFALMFMMTILIFKWITDPFERLKSYVRGIRDGDQLSLPDLPQGEFSELGSSIEEMQETINDQNKIEKYVLNLTHELKSPLTGISAAAEICYGEAQNATIKKFAGNIKRESIRIKDLLDILLKISSLKTITSIDKNEKIKLNQMFNELKDDLSPQLNQKQLNLNIVGEREYRGNRFLLYQMFRNIIQNAINYSPDSGEINCEIKDNLIIISDQGEGIPSYALDKIFDRFYSVPSPNKKSKSSGLGLTFSKEVAAIHGGSISAQNGKKGAIFTTYLE